MKAPKWFFVSVMGSLIFAAAPVLAQIMTMATERVMKSAKRSGRMMTDTAIRVITRPFTNGIAKVNTIFLPDWQRRTAYRLDSKSNW